MTHDELCLLHGTDIEDNPACWCDVITQVRNRIAKDIRDSIDRKYHTFMWCNAMDKAAGIALKS